MTPTKIDLNPWTTPKPPKIPLLRKEPMRVRLAASSRRRQTNDKSSKARTGSCTPVLPSELLQQIQTWVRDSRRVSPDYGEVSTLKANRRMMRRDNASLLAPNSYRRSAPRRKPGGLIPLHTQRTPEELPTLEVSTSHLLSPTQGRSLPSLDRSKQLLKETVSVVLPQVYEEVNRHRKNRLRKKVEARTAVWEDRNSLTMSGDWT